MKVKIFSLLNQTKKKEKKDCINLFLSNNARDKNDPTTKYESKVKTYHNHPSLSIKSSSHGQQSHILTEGPESLSCPLCYISLCSIFKCSDKAAEGGKKRLTLHPYSSVKYNRVRKVTRGQSLKKKRSIKCHYSLLNTLIFPNLSSVCVKS